MRFNTELSITEKLGCAGFGLLVADIILMIYGLHMINEAEWSVRFPERTPHVEWGTALLWAYVSWVVFILAVLLLLVAYAYSEYWKWRQKQ